MISENLQQILQKADLITQAEAARLREVTAEAINDLIKRGKLDVFEVAGQKLLRRDDVISYRPGKGGRPPKHI